MTTPAIPHPIDYNPRARDGRPVTTWALDEIRTEDGIRGHAAGILLYVAAIADEALWADSGYQHHTAAEILAPFGGPTDENLDALGYLTMRGAIHTARVGDPAEWAYRVSEAAFGNEG